MGRELHSILANLARAHGPLMSLRLGTQTIIVASSPAAAREILKIHDKTLSGRPLSHATPVITQHSTTSQLDLLTSAMIIGGA